MSRKVTVRFSSTVYQEGEATFDDTELLPYIHDGEFDEEAFCENDELASRVFADVEPVDEVDLVFDIKYQD